MAHNEYLYMVTLVRPAMLSEGPTPQEAAIRERHVAYVGRLQESGRLILAGRVRAELQRTFGLVIFRADDEIEARVIMESDPAVSEGLMTAELFEFPLAFAGTLSADEPAPD